MERFAAFTTFKFVLLSTIISPGILLVRLPIAVSISTGAVLGYGSSSHPVD